MTQPNRKNRRAVEAQQRHQPSTNGAAAKLSQIDHNVTALINAHRENSLKTNQGFGHLQQGMFLQDMHISVQYRILNDIRKGNVMVDENGDIALQHYHLLRACADVLVAFFAKLQELTATKAEEETPVGDLVPLPDFGGDHAST